MNRHILMTKLRKYLISGLLVWIPLVITVFVIKFIVDLLSSSLLLMPTKYQPDALIGFHIPGIGVLLTLLVIFLTGLLVANLIGQRLVRWGERIMKSIPLVRTVYTGVKQVTETLFTPGGQSFRKVLLVEYPCAGVWSVAFQTGEISGELAAEKDMVSYFIPTTPNPTSGFLMMAPKSRVKELDMTVEQALKFVISLGVMQPSAANPKPIIKNML